MGGNIRFDAAEFLEDDEAIALYLKEAIGKGNKKLFLRCLADAARARMVNEFALKHGMDRDNLWNMLTDDIEPAPEVLTKLMETFAVHDGQLVG